MIVEAVRLIVTLSTTAIGFQIGRSWSDWFPGWAASADRAIVWGAVLGAGIGYVMGGPFGRAIQRGLDKAPRSFDKASTPSLFAGAFGLTAGLAVGVVISVPIVLLLPPVAGWPIAGIVVLVLAAFGWQVFSSRAGDIVELINRAGGGPVRISTSQAGEGDYLLDSSAAIDGRVLDLAGAGLLRARTMVPTFVIDELQAIADAGDKNRRRRGRRGLDILDGLREALGADFVVLDDTVPEHDEVDAKLLSLAARSGATLVTTDHNLARAAGLRDVTVLNPHSLGESLRPQIESGESIRVTIEKEGSEEGQGVGYLDDGTMVVVAGASDSVGETVEAEISNLLRTSVGRMAFAKIAGSA